MPVPAFDGAGGIYGRRGFDLVYLLLHISADFCTFALLKGEEYSNVAGTMLYNLLFAVDETDEPANLLGRDIRNVLATGWHSSKVALTMV